MDWTLEVVILPVSDIDRAVEFYRDKVGFHVDIEPLLLRNIVRVLDRRAQHLLNHRRNALGGEVDRVQRLLDSRFGWGLK